MPLDYNKNVTAEVFVNGEWVTYDMAGKVTLEDKAWHNNLPCRLILIAEGEYPVRFNGVDNGTIEMCFYKRG